jgi:hypothetical protein
VDGDADRLRGGLATDRTSAGHHEAVQPASQRVRQRGDPGDVGQRFVHL